MTCVRSVKRVVTSVRAQLRELFYLPRNPRVGGAKHPVRDEVVYGGLITGENYAAKLSGVDCRSCRTITVIRHRPLCVGA
jgi:hypothetical protein